MKNLPGNYRQNQKEQHQNRQYLVNKNKKIPLNSALPDLGINVGNMAGGYTHNILLNNTCHKIISIVSIFLKLS